MTARRPDVAFEVVDGARTPPPPLSLPPSDAEPDEVSLTEYLDVLVQGRWLVAAAVALALAAGGAYALIATPLYRSDALVQVEDAKAAKGLLGDLSSAFGESSPAETEIEILRSRALVGAVVRDLRLEIVAEPRRFPLVGAAVARRFAPSARPEPVEGGGSTSSPRTDSPAAADVAGPVLGLSAYGWGGERIRVDRFDVPRSLVGEPFTLVAGEAGRYTLLDPEGAPLLTGEVGVVAAGRDVELFVSELRARPGLEFSVVRRDRDDTVAGLQEALKISEKGKKTGMLRLALDGPTPAQIAAILDGLAHAYVRQNVERRSAEARKTLGFLEEQLPVLRGKLDAAEGELESYRSRKGSVDVTLEAQASIARAVEIEKALSTVEVERAALRQKFTADHPAIVALDRKVRQLGTERDALDERLKRLPHAELESARRLRDVKVANELYLVVLNKAQELRVVKEGEIGNVRVLDAAIVPVKPVAPRRLSVLALSLLAGLGLGVAGAFARRALSEGVEDPDAVERATGVSVHASVPRSAAQEEANRRAGRTGATPPLLAGAGPKELAIESLRSLRTSLQFALVEARNAIVSIGGPSPGVGKSFVAANLAHLLGEAGKRVLLVDADLRRGHLHRQFGYDRGPGLSDVIAGAASAVEAVRETGSPNVSILTTGTVPPNPAELLGSERFQRLLAELSARFDLVLVDTPPILAVTDGALVARQAGVNLLVLRAGKHPMREIAAALRQLGRNGVRVDGLVMNDVRLDRGLGRRNAYHYQYKYE